MTLNISAPPRSDEICLLCRVDTFHNDVELEGVSQVNCGFYDNRVTRVRNQVEQKIQRNLDAINWKMGKILE